MGSEMCIRDSRIGGKSGLRPNHCHHHDHIHGEGLYLLCHSCGSLSGMHHHTVPFHRALDDRTGFGKPVPYWLYADLLRRRQSDLGEKIQSCQYAPHHRHCSHLGTASFWGITEYIKGVKSKISRLFLFLQSFRRQNTSLWHTCLFFFFLCKNHFQLFTDFLHWNRLQS